MWAHVALCIATGLWNFAYFAAIRPAERGVMAAPGP